MITQEYIDNELTLAKKLFLYYTDKMVDYLRINNQNYSKWYRDSLQLYFLVKFIENIKIVGEDLYMGVLKVNDNYLLAATYKVREYNVVDMDIAGEFGENIVYAEPGYITPFEARWVQNTIIVPTDNTTELALPFDLSVADPNSIQLTVNGDTDPNYTTDTNKDGYHIVGSTLYWHNFYGLLKDDVVVIQYFKIKG